MKPLILLAVFVASFSIGASARTSQRAEREATQVFWDFSTCVVAQSDNAAKALLDKQNWSQAECLAAGRLARSSSGCLLSGGMLSFKPDLFRGSMASAAFVKNRRGEALPTYAKNPPVFPFPTAKDMENGPAYQRALYLAFAGCVFRNRPEDVRKILESRPFSKGEGLLWQQLNPVLGACLPASEGVQIRFSRVMLRGLLGEAAYAEDVAVHRHADSRLGASH